MGLLRLKEVAAARYFWYGRYPKTITKRFRNVNKAVAFIKSQVSAQIAKGYDKMPGRVTIH